MNDNTSIPLARAPAVDGADGARMLPLAGVQDPNDARSALLQVLLTGLDSSNGANRLRSLAANVDNITPETTAILVGAMCRLSGFDGTNYDRLRTLLDSSDAQASGVVGLLGIMSRMQAFNGTTFDRVRTLDDAAEADPAISTGLLGVVARLQGYNGATFDRLNTLSSDNVGGKSGLGGLVSAGPGEFAVEHRPAASAVATISLGAVASVRNVCRSITASLVATVTQTQVDVVLRDGATGAGTILWSARVAATAGQCVNLFFAGLNIVGTANTAMTLEFLAAPTATNFEGVALTGYTTGN